jgi:hypothetical protein
MPGFFMHICSCFDGVQDIQEPASPQRIGQEYQRCQAPKLPSVPGSAWCGFICCDDVTTPAVPATG